MTIAPKTARKHPDFVGIFHDPFQTQKAEVPDNGTEKTPSRAGLSGLYVLLLSRF